MTTFRTLFATGATLAAATMMPAAANAATCGVSQSRALYETPDVQVYASKGRAVACLRATGRTRVVGPRSGDGATTLVQSVVGGRWLSSVRAGTGGTSEPNVYELLDLRTGRKAQVAERSTRLETVMLPGVLVHALGDGRGVVARFTSGRRTVLSRVKDAEGIAAVGDRVYWMEPGGDEPKVRSARLRGVPRASAAGDPPALQAIGRCAADAASTLLRHDRSRVVSQSADGLRVCNRWTGKAWNVAGADTEFTELTADGVAYRTPVAAGLLRFATSAKVELPVSQDASAVASATFLAGVTADGLRVANAAKPAAAPQVAAPGAVTDVAAALVPSSERPEDDSVVYWTDAEGKPRRIVAGS